MVVLADEILESFFETDFNSTFRLEPVPLEIPSSNPSVLGSLWSNIASDDNRKLLNIVTDQIGRTIGKHQVGSHIATGVECSQIDGAQVYHRPAIGKITSLEEPKARESLLTPTMRRSSSQSFDSQVSDGSSTVITPSTSTSKSTSLLTVETPPSKSKLSLAEYSPMPSMLQAAANAASYMERTPFAIDDAKDDEEEEDDESGVEDDGVMDEVSFSRLEIP